MTLTDFHSESVVSFLDQSDKANGAKAVKAYILFVVYRSRNAGSKLYFSKLYFFKLYDWNFIRCINNPTRLFDQETAVRKDWLFSLEYFLKSSTALP